MRKENEEELKRILETIFSKGELCGFLGGRFKGELKGGIATLEDINVPTEDIVKCLASKMDITEAEVYAYIDYYQDGKLC